MIISIEELNKPGLYAWSVGSVGSNLGRKRPSPTALKNPVKCGRHRHGEFGIFRKTMPVCRILKITCMKRVYDNFDASTSAD